MFKLLPKFRWRPLGPLEAEQLFKAHLGRSGVVVHFLR
jgi:hypothetical protein